MGHCSSGHIAVGVQPWSIPLCACMSCMFSKWVEVILLPCHNGASAAEAFLKICLRVGAPRVVRSDNGTELQNAIV